MVEVLRVESVGARVGRDLRRDAIGAVVVATIFMGAFIALQFRNVSWSFGAGAVIALVHDILVVVGALVIAQLQFDLTTLAALLTVIGYSVHDTIIVSDRIREDALKRRREALPEIMNRAINETLSRTILTPGVAIVVLIALLALGWADFAPLRIHLAGRVYNRHLFFDLHRGSSGAVLGAASQDSGPSARRLTAM